MVVTPVASLAAQVSSLSCASIPAALPDAGMPPAQFDAYLGKPSTPDLLRRIDGQAPGLLRRHEIDRRLQRRRFLLGEFLKWVPDPSSPGNREIAHAFRMLADPLSIEVGRAIERGEFELRLRSDAEFDREVGEISKKLFPKRPVDPSTQSALYVRGGRLEPHGVLFVRRRPLDLDVSLPPVTVFFEILAMIVHEYQHHRDMRPGGSLPASALFPLELKAHAVEFLWRAAHGDADLLGALLQGYASHASAGFVLRFRDYFERYYAGDIESG